MLYEYQIDHVVALKEAWDSGAWGWEAERRSAFGNDLEDVRSLRAVTGSVNQSKSAADPSNWIPPAPPDLDCGEISLRRFDVVPPDPHDFDRDGDGVGCESCEVGPV
jgi:hypothetical protein